ncbi:uncharacterized protein [Polyergus mexicanus]|uniref:uncharacterized protein n=1 Tax=Polyergus mexicanus TaxID=615972 RepID=UPI0038B65C00
MRVVCTFCGLFLAIAIVNCSPIVKRDAEELSQEDLSPLNEVYVFEVDEADGDKGDKDRDKRKIGLTLGIKNGILNFVFGKVDSLLDSKIKALDVLDESNKAKNAIYGIDPTKSRTSEFINGLVSKKIQSATSSIGPLINSASTLFSGASAGFSSAVASKFAPLSSLSGGLSGGGAGGGGGSALIGTLLSQGIGALSSISQGSGGLSGGLSGGGQATSGKSDTSSGSQSGAGINVGAFANLAGKVPITTTTDDTPVFDRTRVSLDIPPRAFGTGFNLITNISQIFSSLILMYISSINALTASWLLLCLIKPLYSEVEKSYVVPCEINNTMHQPESVFSEKQIQSNVSKLSQYIYHRNYQSNSVPSEILSKDTYPVTYMKENVTKSMPEYRLERRYQETGTRDEEIMLKISALEKLLYEDTDDEHGVESNTVEDSIIAGTSIPEETKRVVRQVRRQRPGFFYTLAKLAFETFNDTRSAIQQINSIIGENFEPDTTARPSIVSSNSLQVNDVTTVTATSNDQNDLSSNTASINVTTMRTTTMRTTEAPFRFTRNGLQDLISRNLRGLMRLLNIEWQDALNQSDISVKEFQRNLGKQVGGFLQDNPNAF